MKIEVIAILFHRFSNKESLLCIIYFTGILTNINNDVKRVNKYDLYRILLCRQMHYLSK